MATVPSGDTRLVDLYANRGNADPLVVAALDAASTPTEAAATPDDDAGPGLVEEADAGDVAADDDRGRAVADAA